MPFNTFDFLDTTNDAVRVVQAVPLTLSVSGLTVNSVAVQQVSGNVGQAAGPWAVSGTILNAALTDAWDSINHLFRTKEQGTPTVLVGNTPNVGIANAGSGPYPVTQITSPWVVSGSVSAGGYTGACSGSFTRTANTTTYAANTAVANATGSATVITLANAARVAGGAGVITGARLLDGANQSTSGQFELWIYTVSPGTVIADNANWAPVLADLQNLVGVITFNTLFVGNNTSGGGGNQLLTGTLSPNPMGFNLPSGTSLYAQLVVRNGYTPVSGESFSFLLSVQRD